MNYAQGGALAPGIDGFGWIRNKTFDSVFIFGIATLALVSGFIPVFRPHLFDIILVLDLWFLGYHHVISTFTRLSFDFESFKEHKFLTLGLLPLVLVVTLGFLKVFGFWIIATTFLYWQWFHYTRQSWGIARVYQCKVDPTLYKIDQWALYAIPLAGIAYRSFQAPETFLYMKLKVIPVSLEVVQLLFLASVILFILWAIRVVKSLAEGKTSIAYVFYMISHFVIFTVGYIVIENINYGWLVLNVWHNAQYILFVWLYNNKRFNNEISENHRLLSRISLSENQWLYYGFCMAITVFVYFSISKILIWLNFAVIYVSLSVYMAINFHHYIVDGLIWKVRSKPMQKTLALKGRS